MEKEEAKQQGRLQLGQGRPWWQVPSEQRLERARGQVKSDAEENSVGRGNCKGCGESLEGPWGKPAGAAREGGADASVGEGSVGAGLAAGKIQNTPLNGNFS